VLRPRFIPVLLLKDGILVKTIRFRKEIYVGDPINAVRIFNDKGVDEIIILDISAAGGRRSPDLRLIEKIASEAFVPLTYGGGISKLSQIRELLRTGIEKVCLNSRAVTNPELVTEAAAAIGSSSVVVGIDIRRTWTGRAIVATHGGRRAHSIDPVAHAQRAVELGAGEILLNDIDRDGTMAGYNLAMIRQFAQALQVPLVACGGAGSVADLRAALIEGQASAAAAGSLFVFKKPHRAVLITFPAAAQEELAREMRDVAADLADDR
jgi:cyclase